MNRGESLGNTDTTGRGGEDKREAGGRKQEVLRKVREEIRVRQENTPKENEG